MSRKTFRSAVLTFATGRAPIPSSRPNRRLKCEPLEGRLLLSVDSWVVPRRGSLRVAGTERSPLDCRGQRLCGVQPYEGETDTCGISWLRKYSLRSGNLRGTIPVPSGETCNGARSSD